MNWINIPPYAPSQGGSWESMVKLFKTVLGRVMEQTRCKPSLFELQTFFTDAVGIVNDRLQLHLAISSMICALSHLRPFWDNTWPLTLLFVGCTIRGTFATITCITPR